MREPENGDWLRRQCVLQWGFVVPTVPVPFFGRRHWGTVEKGDRHRAGKTLGGFGADCSSEPVPLFHSTQPTLQFSWMGKEVTRIGWLDLVPWS